MAKKSKRHGKTPKAHAHTKAVMKKRAAKKAGTKSKSPATSSKTTSAKGRSDRDVLVAELKRRREAMMAWPLRTAYKPKLKPTGKDTAASLRVGKFIEATGLLNVRRLIEFVDEFADAALVEGYIVLAIGGVHEHAWVVHRGKIIDPTWPDGKHKYFPGLEFEGRGVIAEFDEISVREKFRVPDAPFFYAFGWGGLDSPHMIDAYIKALKADGLTGQYLQQLQARAAKLSTRREVAP
jgi:hypothetical protein